MSIGSVPVELVLQIAAGLEGTRDVLNLSFTCTALYKILWPIAIQRDAKHQARRAQHLRIDFSIYECINSDFETWAIKVGYLDDAPRPKKPGLYWAIENHASIDEVKRIESLFQQAYPKLRDEGWHPSWDQPLTLAIRNSRRDVIRLLIDVGYSASGVSRPKFKEDALLVACSVGDNEAAEFLVEKGAQTQDPGSSLFAATYYRMCHVVKALVRYYRGEKASGYKYEGEMKLAMWSIACGTDTDTRRTMEIIEILQAEKHFQQTWPNWFQYIFLITLETSNIQNAECLFDWLKRHHAKETGIFNDVFPGVACCDRALPITKQLCEEPPLAEIHIPNLSVAEGWRNKECVLYYAITLTSEEYPYVRHTCPSETIQYLLDIGSKISASHMAGIVKTDDPKTLDRIFARDGCFPEFTGSKKRDDGEYDRLIDYALHKGSWRAAFRLIHYGERCEPILFFVKVRLWAEATMFLDKIKSDTKRIAQEVFNEMIAGRSEPDLEVFNTIEEAESKEFMRQLWTLFQHTFGNEFTAKCQIMQRFIDEECHGFKGHYTDEFGDFVERHIEV